MSWLFPLAKSASSSAAGSPAGLTSLQQQKQRLIESLRNSHSSIAEIQKDVEYRLPFTVNNLTININILLPPQFPQEKPVISVYPPIRHHLMDSQGLYVTSPLVSNFTMHSDLGKIIQSLLDEFWKNPPVLAPTSTTFPYLYSNPGGMPPYPSQGFPFLPPYPPPEANRNITSLSVADTVSSSTTSYTAAKPVAPSFGILSSLPLPVPTTESSASVNQNGFGYKMPDIPDAFPELSELSVSQLTDMNEQEEVLLEQFLMLPQLKQIITDKEDLVKNIEELARKNLLLEHSLEGKRQTVLDKYELLLQMKSTFEKKMQRQHELSEVGLMSSFCPSGAAQPQELAPPCASDFIKLTDSWKQSSCSFRVCLFPNPIRNETPAKQESSVTAIIKPSNKKILYIKYNLKD